MTTAKSRGPALPGAGPGSGITGPAGRFVARRAPLVLVAAMLAVAGFGVLAFVALGKLQGSGAAATQSRALPRFSRLDLAGSANVTVIAGRPQSVVVHADSNLIGHVTTRVVAGTLAIGTTGSFTTKVPMTVQISVPSLAAVTLSGSGEISVSRIEAPQLTVALSGSGTLYASGTATELHVTVGGSGTAQLSRLIARDAHAVVSGSGLLRVSATASLSATVSDSGAIIYRGNPPQVTRDITGSGTVTAG